MINKIKIEKVFSVKEARDNLPKIVNSKNINVITKRGKISSVIIPASILKELLSKEDFKEFLFEVYLTEEANKRIEEISKNKKLETVSADALLKEIGK